MTCEECGVALPDNAARSAMSGQWLCGEHKVFTAAALTPQDLSALVREIEALKERCAVIESTRIEDAHSLWGSLDDIDLEFHKHVALTFWQRLRWLLLGH